ncbi:hypothetical protein M1L60_13460 [Actinoplanes sp. TRM 88003]|uniref:Double-GTPase 2 domain-containing protein n=1 Tax=Paractinoplanes aksuensis TaxID=2939490 RepID=A0ABT1DNI3_9ACTN|nr:hypothetical protein [Actinoplanes aksuensis]MCO8271600.1 hypothetical protein [Actinoplanes aksuensis]
MTKLNCPFCYNTIRRRSELHFMCRGRPTGARPACQPELDQVRSNLTGFKEATLPTFEAVSENLMLPFTKAHCPKCGGETTTRACSHCHTRLPMEFGLDASPMVAMVGARGTGKTVYLTVLSNELQKPKIRSEFAATVRPIGEGQDGFGAQDQWVRESIHQVYEDRKLFSTTAQAVDGRKAPIVLEWRGRHNRRFVLRKFRTNYLSFYDTAGEDLTADDVTFKLHYLRAADYLILLLDPFQLPEVQRLLRLPPAALLHVREGKPPIDVLARVTEALKQGDHWNGRHITVPVAVAFAKMDAFNQHLPETHPLRARRRTLGGYDEKTGRIIHEEMKSLLHEWGGDEIDAHLSGHYRSYQYFAVSALGAEPDYENYLVNPRGVRPDRVEEPLLWLMHKGGLVPRAAS